MDEQQSHQLTAAAAAEQQEEKGQTVNESMNSNVPSEQSNANDEDQQESWEWNGPNFADLDREESEIYADFQDDRTGGGVLSLSNRELPNLSPSYLASEQHKRDLLMFDDHDDTDVDSVTKSEANNENLVDQEERVEEEEEELLFTDDLEDTGVSGTSRKTVLAKSHNDFGGNTLSSSAENTSFATAVGEPALGDTQVWKERVTKANSQLNTQDLQTDSDESGQTVNKKTHQKLSKEDEEKPSYMRATKAATLRVRQKHQSAECKEERHLGAMALTKSSKDIFEADKSLRKCQQSQGQKSGYHHFAEPTASSSASRHDGFESMASGVHKFFSDVPSRYHSQSRKFKREETDHKAQEKRKLTIPVSPKLHYEERAKTRHGCTHDSIAEKAAASTQHKPFKARPWNKELFSTVKLPEKASRRPPTVPQSPNCNHHEKKPSAHCHPDELHQKVQQFKARPMPKYLTTEPNVRSKDHTHPLTTPESPMLSTKQRATVRPPAPPVCRNEKTQQGKTESHNYPPTIPESRPYNKGTTQAAKPKHTRPKPFNISSQQNKDVRKAERTTAKAAREPQERPIQTAFKARPVPKAVKQQTKAFRPAKSNKPPTRVVSLCLHTDKRTEARKQFEERNKERLKEMELKKQKEEEEKRLKEEEEIRRLRKEALVFKARPVRIHRHGESKEAHRSKSKATVPETPPLYTEERVKDHKCKQNQDTTGNETDQKGKGSTAVNSKGMVTRRMAKGQENVEDMDVDVPVVETTEIAAL